MAVHLLRLGQLLGENLRWRDHASKDLRQPLQQLGRCFAREGDGNQPLDRNPCLQQPQEVIDEQRRLARASGRHDDLDARIGSQHALAHDVSSSPASDRKSAR